MNASRDPMALAAYIQKKTIVARNHGIELSYHRDFQELKAVASQLDDRPGVQPYFDIEQSETSGLNAFWVKGESPAGEVVHIQAVRRLDLGEHTLVDHFHEFKRLYAFPGFGIDLDATEVRDSWLAQTITGVCAYHGEIWIRKDYRNQNLGQSLPRLAVALAQLEWQPSFMYGFVVPELALRGITQRYGYCHVHPVPFIWRNKQGDLARKIWLVMMKAAEFMDIIWDEENHVLDRPMVRAV